MINIIVYLIREHKEKVVALVLLGHLVPEVSLVSWVSLVLKEMMVLLARMENEVALEGLAFRYVVFIYLFLAFS